MNGADFTAGNSQFVAEGNSMNYMSNDGGNSYNLCHCKSQQALAHLSTLYVSVVWSNFEIASMDFWRGEAYTKFFEHLDATGGFYYEVPILRLSAIISVINGQSAVGRCSRAQHCSGTLRQEGANPFLRRYRVRTQPIHALSKRQRALESESLFL